MNKKDKKLNLDILIPFEKFLNSHKDNINIVNNDGWNLLHYFSYEGFIKFINILLKEKYHFDVNLPCNDGSTSLLLSIKNKQYDCALELINHGSDCNIYDRNYDTPMIYICKYFSFKDSDVKSIINRILLKGRVSLPKIYLEEKNMDQFRKIVQNPLVIKKLAKDGFIILEEGIDSSSPKTEIIYSLIYFVKCKNDDLVKEVIKNGANINQFDDNQYNSLNYAINNDDVNTTKILLNHKIKINCEELNDKSPIIMTIKQNNPSLFKIIMEYIYEKKLKKNTGEMEKFIDRIVEYANGKKDDDIKIFISKNLEEKIYPNQQKLNAITMEVEQYYHSNEFKKEYPLHYACYTGDIKYIKNIKNSNDSKEKIIDINQQMKDGSTPIMVAIKNNQYECVKFLLEFFTSIDVNIPNYYGITPLSFLLNKNNNDNDIYDDDTLVNIYIQLMNHNAYYDIKYIKYDQTIFNNLIENPTFIQYIKKNGLQIKDNHVIYYHNDDLIRCCIDHSLDHFLSVLLKNDIKIQQNTILYCFKEKNKMLFEMIMSSLSEDEKEPLIKTIVSDVFNTSNYSFTSLILLEKVTTNPSIKNIIQDIKKNNKFYKEKGYVPMHKACEKENYQLIKDLLENKCNVNLRKTITKETPIMYSIKTKKYDVAIFLLNNSDHIDVNLPDSDHMTPLTYMILDDDGNNNEVFEGLIKHKANLSQDYNDDNLFLLSIKCNKNDYAKIILQNKKKNEGNEFTIHQPCKNGKTVLSNMIEEVIHNEEAFQLLFENGAWIEPSYIHKNLLTNPIENNISLIKSILRHGLITYKIEENTKKRVVIQSPLIYFIKTHKDKMVEKLLEQGASVNDKDEKGYAAIYHVIEMNNIHLFRLFIHKYHVNVNITLPTGNSLLSYAINTQKNQMMINELQLLTSNH
eukprot:jgi/Orpsp1_1/1177031/evm.model.c7180000059913.2